MQGWRIFSQSGLVDHISEMSQDLSQTSNIRGVFS